jgi:hypothetical protein
MCLSLNSKLAKKKKKKKKVAQKSRATQQVGFVKFLSFSFCSFFPSCLSQAMVSQFYWKAASVLGEFITSHFKQEKEAKA